MVLLSIINRQLPDMWFDRCCPLYLSQWLPQRTSAKISHAPNRFIFHKGKTSHRTEYTEVTLLLTLGMCQSYNLLNMYTKFCEHLHEYGGQ